MLGYIKPYGQILSYICNVGSHQVIHFVDSGGWSLFACLAVIYAMFLSSMTILFQPLILKLQFILNKLINKICLVVMNVAFPKCQKKELPHIRISHRALHNLDFPHCSILHWCQQYPHEFNPFRLKSPSYWEGLRYNTSHHTYSGERWY